jgi:hypothetical protein
MKRTMQEMMAISKGQSIVTEVKEK